VTKAQGKKRRTTKTTIKHLKVKRSIEEHRREECSSKSSIKEQALPSRRKQEQEQTRKHHVSR
jgi:hypothetical protein